MGNVSNVKLLNWTVCEEGRLHGNILNGHSVLPDGMYVNTTRIVSFEAYANCIAVKTKNTQYFLDFDEYAYNECNEDILKQVFNAKIAKSIMKVVKEKQKKTQALYAEIADLLQPNQYFLALNVSKGYYFDFGVYKNENGEAETIDKCVHVGTFQDSVLLGSKSKRDILRYFPYAADTVEFYTQLEQGTEDEADGIIKNLGQSVLNVYFTWNKGIRLNPCEGRAIYRNMPCDFGNKEGIRMPEDEVFGNSYFAKHCL